MTSTNFNIGLGDSSRPSSRVLRPPGGGHTNIFAEPDPEPVRRDNGRNASSILEGTNTNPPTQSPAKPSPTSTASVNQPEPAQQSQRPKVPPGGFSSGLW